MPTRTTPAACASCSNTSAKPGGSGLASPVAIARYAVMGMFLVGAAFGGITRSCVRFRRGWPLGWEGRFRRGVVLLGLRGGSRVLRFCRLIYSIRIIYTYIQRDRERERERNVETNDGLETTPHCHNQTPTPTRSYRASRESKTRSPPSRRTSALPLRSQQPAQRIPAHSLSLTPPAMGKPDPSTQPTNPPAATSSRTPQAQPSSWGATPTRRLRWDVDGRRRRGMP